MQIYAHPGNQVTHPITHPRILTSHIYISQTVAHPVIHPIIPNLSYHLPSQPSNTHTHTHTHTHTFSHLLHTYTLPHTHTHIPSHPSCQTYPVSDLNTHPGTQSVIVISKMASLNIMSRCGRWAIIGKITAHHFRLQCFYEQAHDVATNGRNNEANGALFLQWAV